MSYPESNELPFHSKSLKEGQLVSNRFKILRKIGSGSFGEIYLSVDCETQQKIAVKFESLYNSNVHLTNEYRFYKLVQNEVGFPKIFTFEKADTYITLVLELLNKSLKELHDLCNKKFSIKTVLYIAIQILNRLEVVHNKRFVYRDMKPENFMIGFPGNPNGRIIYIIDFGLVREYINPQTQQHVPMSGGKRVTGTIRYMSCNGHFNNETSRRDDLESLGYMLLFFLTGNLPWSGMIKLANGNPIVQCQKIGSIKQALSPEIMFDGYPEVFANYLNYARNLKFDETPNYEMLRNNFKSQFAKMKIPDDNIYDWDNLLNDQQTTL